MRSNMNNSEKLHTYVDNGIIEGSSDHEEYKEYEEGSIHSKRKYIEKPIDLEKKISYQMIVKDKAKSYPQVYTGECYRSDLSDFMSSANKEQKKDKRECCEECVIL